MEIDIPKSLIEPLSNFCEEEKIDQDKDLPLYFGEDNDFDRLRNFIKDNCDKQVLLELEDFRNAIKQIIHNEKMEGGKRIIKALKEGTDTIQ